MNYLETDDVLIKYKTTVSTDAIILDIDGVLLDVSKSFRQCIINTVQYYFEKVVKIPGEVVLMTFRDTQAFKNAGGFNNDWDLTKAAILYYLSNLIACGKRDLSSVKYGCGEDLHEFLQNVSIRGSGLEAAKDQAMERLAPQQRKDMLGLYNPIYIKKVFQEYYGGIDFCKRLYGFDPRFIKLKGLINAEKPLIDTSYLENFEKIGILTGRTLEETDFALAKTGMGKYVPRDHLVYDKGKGSFKPDPSCLVELAEKMGIKNGLYIGDTMDDALLITNYNAGSTSGKFNLAMVTNRPDLFLGIADIMAADVNKILKYLTGL